MDLTDLDEGECPTAFDGYDDAIIGTADVWDQTGQRTTRFVYDGWKIVEILVAGGCDLDEAREFIDFNVEGAYVGPDTPIVVW